MILIEDTRNKIDKHKTKRQCFENLGHKVVRTKLFVGDYSLLNNQSICIDTKQDWVEVANNVCGKSHERFRNECIKAKNCDIRLVILVEEETPVEQWKSPLKRNRTAYTQVKGETLAKAIHTMHEKYGVEFINCDRSESADKILEILGVKNEE